MAVASLTLFIKLKTHFIYRIFHFLFTKIFQYDLHLDPGSSKKLSSALRSMSSIYTYMRTSIHEYAHTHIHMEHIPTYNLLIYIQTRICTQTHTHTHATRTSTRTHITTHAYTRTLVVMVVYSLSVLCLIFCGFWHL